MKPTTRLLAPTALLTIALITGCEKPGDAAPPPSQSLETESGVSPLHEALAARLARRDSDYDGRTDVEENVEETDPQDPSSRRQTRLGLWRFDDDAFTGDAGEAPLRMIGATRVEGQGDGALRLDPDNSAATLAFRAQEPSGKSNINLREGSLVFRFKPDWDSGTGPGNLGVLLSVGVWRQDAGYPFWGLVVNGTGDTLTFRANVDGQKHVFLEAPVEFRSGQWVEIRLAYNPHVALLHIDGREIARQGLGGAPLIPPMEVIESDGFDIGANRYGGHPAKGDFDELATYNYMLEPTLGQAYLESSLGIEIRDHPLRVALSAPMAATRALTVRKRQLPDGAWSHSAKTFHGGLWLDALVQEGHRYEYQCLDSRGIVVRDAIAAVRTEEDSDHGLLALVTASSLPRKLDTDFLEYQNARIAEGWQVRRFTIERHHPNSPGKNRKALDTVRTSLSQWRASESDKPMTVFLVGRAPIFESGSLNPDGHGQRPFPVDGIYGDLEGHEAWLEPETKELLGLTRWPGALEASVGRLDFTDMKPGGVTAYKRYFEKRGAYDRGDWKPTARSLAFPTYGYPSLNRMRSQEAIALSSALFGDDLAMVHYKPFTELGALVAHTAGYGAHNRITLGSRDRLFLSRDFVQPDRAQPVAVHLLDGSYFGDWSVAGNFLRATLLPRDSGLATIWCRTRGVDLRPMATGASIGESLRASINHRLEFSQHYDGPGLFTTVIGDPTIRFFTPEAPRDVRFDPQPMGAEIAWKAAGVSTLIERSDGGLRGVFRQVARLPEEVESWTDSSPLTEKTHYRIRQLHESRTGRGIVYRWSHGVLIGANAST